MFYLVTKDKLNYFNSTTIIVVQTVESAPCCWFSPSLVDCNEHGAASRAENCSPCLTVCSTFFFFHVGAYR